MARIKGAKQKQKNNMRNRGDKENEKRARKGEDANKR